MLEEVMGPAVICRIRPRSPCWVAMSNLHPYGYWQEAEVGGVVVRS
jgi:hypothetical protein